MRPLAAQGCYRPSGSFTALGLLLCVCYGGALGVIGGPVYAYLSVYNPLVYFTFLATLALGAGTGFLSADGAMRGKLRSPWLGGVCGASAGAIGLYLHWVVWIHAFVARAGGELWALAPAQLWSELQAVAATGAWSFSSFVPTGLVLYAIWAVEAGLLTGIPAYTVWSELHKRPFCESCQVWTDQVYQLQLQQTDPEALRTELETGRLDSLAALHPVQTRGRTQVTLHVCPRLGDSGFLSVECFTLRTRKKGQSEEIRKRVVRHLVLNSDQLERARSLA